MNPADDQVSSDHALLARAAVACAQQSQLRNALNVRLDLLEEQVESLFAQSVRFRYNAIRQRQRGSLARLLMPGGGQDGRAGAPAVGAACAARPPKGGR